MRGFRLRSKRENGGNSSERAAQRRQKRACLSLRTSEFLIHFLFLPARIGKDEQYGNKRQKASQNAASARERAAMLLYDAIRNLPIKKTRIKPNFDKSGLILLP